MYLVQPDENMPKEDLHLTALAWQRSETKPFTKEQQQESFWRSKAVVESVLKKLSVNASIQPIKETTAYPWLHPGVAAEICVGRQVIGVIGQCHPSLVTQDCFEAVELFQLNLSMLKQYAGGVSKYCAFSRHPVIQRDIAMLLNQTDAVSEVLATVRKSAGKLCTRLDVVNRYEGKPIPNGKVSVALRLSYQAKNRTLNDAEIDALFKKTVAALRENGIEFR